MIVFTLLVFLAGALYVARELCRRAAGGPQAHVFLDLETLGTKPDAPILVIAAYAVDQTGAQLSRGCWRIDRDDGYGVPCPATIAWWQEQEHDARYAAFTAGARVTTEQALGCLNAFIKPLSKQYGDDLFIWGNSPSFDCAILHHAYRFFKRKAPWAHWQERDCRTVAAIGEAIGYDAKRFTIFEGVKHDALCDARHQARYTMDILNEIRRR